MCSYVTSVTNLPAKKPKRHGQTSGDMFTGWLQFGLDWTRTSPRCDFRRTLMRGRRRFGVILGVLIAVPAFAGDNNKANGENRCDDLGSACVCSESLDESTSIQPTDGLNPPSSTSKQCGGIG